MSSYTVEKYFNEEGKVAVLYSPEFGGGWTTGLFVTERDYRDFYLFDKDLVSLVMKYQGFGTNSEFLSEFIALASFKGIVISSSFSYRILPVVVGWLDPGTEFYIDEYDGRESIILKNEIPWSVA